MSNIKTGDILNFDYTGAVQSITLPKGIYKLECWGAQGGNGCTDNSYTGGKGGYSIGTISLNTKITLYIYVGGRGVSSEASGSGAIRAGGFNGGGSGRDWSSTNHGGSGGAGATDIRINQDSFYARVIVAGGGGGASDDGNGGSGGGVSGISTGASAGTATSGSGFGQAAASSYTSGECGGGGGGWYGGYGGGSENIPGGGGSGYVYISSTASNYPSGCLLNSSYYLSDAKTIAGNNSFVSPTGSSETGHSGNGYCRITVIECKNTALYTRINNSMKKATAFYFKLNNNKMYGIGSANSNGAVMNFDYTGSVQTATLTPGRYKLECWGAEGGNGTDSPNTNGKGGYSVGVLTLSQTLNIFIYAGGAGIATPSASGWTITNGGFNGGGWTRSYNKSVGSGGGGSDIRIGQDSLYSRVIVAGGGGGSGNGRGASGHGGGYNGIGYVAGTGSVSINNNGYNNVIGNYATQTTGGDCIVYQSDEQNNSKAGTFGIGACFYSNNSSNTASGAGGGGWYGGGATNNCSGGGGSGYVYTSSTVSSYPSGCLLNSSYYLTDTQTIAGNQSFLAPSGSTETGHSGNGYVRITKLTDVIYLTHANNDIMDFNYTGSTQSKTLKPGTYTIECWGGQGGTYSGYIGGYGGYSKGTITLTKTTTVYVSVGGAGSSSSTAAGFNGGGTGISSGRGGGGATDVRIGQNSLYSRVIVAGGGGGAGVTSANANPCGCGGGEYGGDGYYNDTTGSYTIGQHRGGGSASQTAGGKTWSTSTQATFGQGGNASGYSCGGGGGGWYGGGGAYDNDSDSDGRWGGGGSGYVYTSSTAKNYPNGCLLNSTHYLTNAQTIAGDTSFTSPTGSAETGHTGNGFCRITNLNPTQYGLYVKTNSGWKHIDL